MREEVHPSLALRTTLGFGGYAQALLEPETEEDCEKLPEWIRKRASTPFVLGRGSNILACDGELDIVLIHPLFPVRMSCIDEGTCDSEQSESKQKVIVRVSASCPLPMLLSWCAKNGFSGLEGLSGIPGTVGGAISMNAGSFGVAIGSHVLRLTLWTYDGCIQFGREDLVFGYRFFGFSSSASAHPDFFLVFDCDLELLRSDPQHVRAECAHYLKKKRDSQPVTEKSAGCVFKNPENESAGRLLESAGFRGKMLGGVGFSAKHANFLINRNQGRASEALELMSMAQDAVLTQTGIFLQPEVRIVH